MTKEIKIPTDKNDNMLRLDNLRTENHIKNYEWKDILNYEGYDKEGNATYFAFTSTLTHKKYYMFTTDFDKCVKKMNCGNITGTFTFVKRGKNYGIKLVNTCWSNKDFNL